MALSSKQRQFLRALAHHKSAVVTIGAAGITGAALIQEIGRVGVLYRAAEPPRLELP